MNLFKYRDTNNNNITFGWIYLKQKNGIRTVNHIVINILLVYEHTYSYFWNESKKCIILGCYQLKWKYAKRGKFS